jgi:hypothetical protein
MQYKYKKEGSSQQQEREDGEWSISQNGNPHVHIGKHHATIFRNTFGHGHKIVISRKKHGVYAGDTFDTVDEAKARAEAELADPEFDLAEFERREIFHRSKHGNLTCKIDGQYVTILELVDGGFVFRLQDSTEGPFETEEGAKAAVAELWDMAKTPGAVLKLLLSNREIGQTGGDDLPW